MASIKSSNPARRLYTEYEIKVAVLTTVPGGGSVLIRAPRDDYFFGSRLPPTGPPPDLLQSTPPASGYESARPLLPAKGTSVPCEIRAKPMAGNL